MIIINDKITITELQEMARKMFGDLVKVVVDVEKEIMAVDGELHSDEEALLIESGSEQKDLWGINIYPFPEAGELIEYDSMINLRPAEGNRTRGVDNLEIRGKIEKIVAKIIIK